MNEEEKEGRIYGEVLQGEGEGKQERKVRREKGGVSGRLMPKKERGVKL